MRKKKINIQIKLIKCKERKTKEKFTMYKTYLGVLASECVSDKNLILLSI